MAQDERSELVKMFDTYMKKCLKNYAIKWKREYYRRINREVQFCSLVDTEQETVEDNVTLFSEEIDSFGVRFTVNDPGVYSAVMALSEKERAVILRLFWAEMNMKDIATLLGVSLKTAYNLRDRAIAKLAPLSEDG